MKVGKPSEKSIKKVGLQLLGFAIGIMAGRAGIGAIHDDSAAGTEEEVKKNNLMGYAKRAGLAVAGGVGAASISSDDDMSVVAKSAAIGVAAIQVIDGVTKVASENSKTAALASGSTASRVAAKALGLNCPCNTQSDAVPMMRPRNNRRGLKAVAYNENDYTPEANGNFFELAMAN